jgi:hypothetical protein
VLFLFCTVCFDHGAQIEKDDPMIDTIISFEYVQYMRKRLNNFVEAEMGSDELARKENLGQIRELT